MNSSNVEGVFDQAKGKIKQAFGEATDNQSLANSGAADQVKGHAKEAWGNVKDAAHDTGTVHETRAEEREHAEGHNLRESLTSTAANVKDSINRGLNHLEHKAND